MVRGRFEAIVATAKEMKMPNISSSAEEELTIR